MNQRKTSPYGCYDRRYLVETLPGLLGVVGAALIALAVPRTPTIRLVILGLASVAVAYLCVVTVASIRRLDELQQRVHLVAIAISFTVTGVITALSRFLELAGVSWIPAGINLWMVMFLVWWTAVVVLSHRYR